MQTACTCSLLKSRRLHCASSQWSAFLPLSSRGGLAGSPAGHPMKASVPAIAWGLVALGIALLPACTRGGVTKEEPTSTTTVAVAMVPRTEPAPAPAKTAQRPLGKKNDCPAGMVLVEGEYC